MYGVFVLVLLVGFSLCVVINALRVYCCIGLEKLVDLPRQSESCRIWV
jgi:hypothetical protein